ncbi:hypothetical protein YC2023_059327 [Brassica napus]
MGFAVEGMDHIKDILLLRWFTQCDGGYMNFEKYEDVLKPNNETRHASRKPTSPPPKRITPETKRCFTGPRRKQALTQHTASSPLLLSPESVNRETLALALLLIESPPLCNSADLIAASHRRRNRACSTYPHDNWRRYRMRLNRRVGFNAIINSSLENLS